MIIYRKNESESDGVFLTFDEVRVLLHSQGFHSCEGIFMPEKNFSAQEVLMAIHNLSKRGILQVMDKDEPYDSVNAEEDAFLDQGKKEGRAWTGDFRIRPDILQMILIMADPVQTMIYRQGETLPFFSKEFHNGREYFCYIVPDQILVVERDWTRKDMLRMRKMSPEEFSVWEEAREKEAAEQENEAEESGSSDAGFLAPIL